MVGGAAPGGGRAAARRGIADRWYRGRWAAVVWCACWFVTVAGDAVGSAALGAPAATGGAMIPAGGAVVVRVLQLNLCGSGFAACYTGMSSAEAAAVIRAERPDLVTLNEVCRDDVSMLQKVLAGEVSAGAVVLAFQAAVDRRTGASFRCRNGEQYGIGVLSRWPSPAGSSASGGVYPVQDAGSPEGRVWLCLNVATTPAVAASATVGVCTTHLAHSKREVAASQCRYLFGTVIAQWRARERMAPVVVGADLNLGSDVSPDLEACLPPGSAVAGDGGEQHVLATPGFVVADTRTVDLHGASDHPALLVTLARATGRGMP
ncbi:MAG: endonuclease/exonuclease/phosphatase family protein [Pseudonocardia sp.]